MAASHPEAVSVQQQLINAGTALTTAAAFGALNCQGGVSDAQVARITGDVTQALQTSLSAQMQAGFDSLRAEVGALTQKVGALESKVGALESVVNRSSILAAKAYNATCGEGGVRSYTEVPNADGDTCPASEQPLRNRAALMALNLNSAGTWCKHYGVAPLPRSAPARRKAVAAHLGIAPGLIEDSTE